ncbi:MAG: 2-oxoacid:acceptor oxidoreductase [Firmicutes bacterium]|nr:2-oxoacid:acceptor oxidoreductase [Bacillota bacterium]
MRQEIFTGINFVRRAIMPRVTIEEELCKGCGHCIGTCPKRIISFAHNLNAKGYKPATVTEDKMDDCIGCGSCYRMCPDSVIKVEK